MTKQDLKIVFLGTPDFAVESLRRMVEGGYNVAAVVTATDKPAGRGHKMLQSAVKQYALSVGLPVLQPQKLRDPEFLAELRAIGADLFVVIAFRMLPEAVWAMPRLGTFNLHAALLPRYRGAAPINRAVMAGDTETGVTTFFLDHDIDTGDIIDRERITIGPDENVGSVHDRLMTLGADLTLRTLDKIIAGTLKTTPQSLIVESGIEATPAPKIFKEDCRIDWNRTADEIHNHVRGLSPYPAAWTQIDDTDAPLTIKIFETRKEPSPPTDAAPGTVTIDSDGKGIIVATGSPDTAIRILSLQPSGKRRMNADEWLRGSRADKIRFK